ncbi:MAG: hypothetical protein Tsb009_31480 [Planctomycetaceae bacterium]
MMKIPADSMNRLKRSIQRDGLLPSVKRFTVNSFNRLFRARLCVWQWKQGDPLYLASRTELAILRFNTQDELPTELHERLVSSDLPDFSSRMQEEFSEGGVLWVALSDDQPAGYQWSRTGQFVENWHCELNASDVLIYSTVTFHEFRGRGIAAAIMAKICREEVGTGGAAYADCMVWNRPAVRFIQKAGFTKIAERKPLADHPD